MPRSPIPRAVALGLLATFAPALAFGADEPSPPPGARSRRAPAALPRPTASSVPPVETETLPDVVVRDSLRAPVTSASPIGPVTALEATQPVGTLSGPALRYRTESSLGATLKNEPGVSSSSFGPGAARPVIRGQGGERIRVLENGTGTLDVSGISDDHAVPVDPTSIERVEIVRGPATLRYGANAIGGVTYLEDGRIPDGSIDRLIAGRLGGAYGTADTERSGFAVVNGRSDAFAWRVAGFARESDDLDIPGLAKSRRLLVEEGNPSGAGEARDTLPNSYAKAHGATVGGSYVTSCGFVGASFGVFSTEYGLPNEADVRIELDRLRADVRGRWCNPWSGVREASWTLAFADYEHSELEGDEIGTLFEQQAFEGRLELVHAPWGRFDGAVGVQGSLTDLEVTGDEALLPEAKTLSGAIFLVERTDLAPCVTLELGGRIEVTSIDSVADESFLAPSASAGLVWRTTKDSTWAISIAYTSRAPSAFELFANGPHVATETFEIGDPDLGLETSFGADLSYRVDSARVTGSATAFWQRYGNYLALIPTGAIDGGSGLEIFRYVEHEAQLYGLEGKAAFHVWRRCEQAVDVELLGDVVRADDLDLDSPLPRIAPLRLGSGLVYRDDLWTARVDVQHSFEQDRSADFELDTDGYTRLDAGVSRTIDLGCDRSLIASLTATNLLDEEIRLHSSFTKDLAPERGRSLRLSFELDF